MGLLKKLLEKFNKKSDTQSSLTSTQVDFDEYDKSEMSLEKEYERQQDEMLAHIHELADETLDLLNSLNGELQEPKSECSDNHKLFVENLRQQATNHSTSSSIDEEIAKLQIQRAQRTTKEFYELMKKGDPR